VSNGEKSLSLEPKSVAMKSPASSHIFGSCCNVFIQNVKAIAKMLTMIGTRSMIVSVFLTNMLMISINGDISKSLVHRRSVPQSKAATTKIVGGKFASEYLSFGFSAGNQLCGGTLIHDDMFLTAARTYGSWRCMVSRSLVQLTLLHSTS
jgi:hypothetical protein